MLSKISIFNFQSHSQTELLLHKNINMIIGSSDSGKTALLRSLSWVINNKPSGDSFRSYFGGDTIVSLTIDNNTVERIKTDKKNQYKLNDKVFEAFGQEVPEEIKNTVNFSDVNFQYQMDAPFLFCESSGEVAKYINKIVDLDLIDRSLSNIEKTKRKFNEKLESERLTLKQYQDELNRFKDLNELEKIIVEAEKLEQDVEDKKSKIVKLKNLIKSISDCKTVLSEINNYLKVESELKEIEEINNNFILKSKQHNTLKSIVENIKLTKDMLIQNDIKLERAESKFKELMPDICPLCGSEIKK